MSNENSTSDEEVPRVPIQDLNWSLYLIYTTTSALPDPSQSSSLVQLETQIPSPPLFDALQPMVISLMLLDLLQGHSHL